MQPCVLLMTMALDLGGAETHVTSLAKALKQSGHRVLVASNGGRLVAELKREGIPHYQVALHARQPVSILKSVLEIRRLVKSQGVDLMHAHARIPAWVGQLVMRMTGAPMVTTYHGLYNAHWFFRMFTSQGLQTIAVSEDVREHLVKRLGFSEAQVRVIPNGIDTEQFRVQAEVSPDQLLYISRLSGRRGAVALTVLSAVENLVPEFPKIRLTIVGEGDQLAAVEQQAAGLNERFGRQVVEVLGGRTDVPELLAGAGLVIGVGRVALEAMAADRPLIVASEYGNQGLLTTEQFELAASRNFSGRRAERQTTPETLASELRKALAQTDQTKAQAAAIGQKVRATYSMEAVLRGVVEVYQTVLSKANLQGQNIRRSSL